MKDLHMLKDNKVMTFAAIWLSEVDDDDAERQEKIENGLVKERHIGKDTEYFAMTVDAGYGRFHNLTVAIGFVSMCNS